ncbi:17559_t:CDS:2 [Entrophospora sp. SA101]|nr:17559_t:CDS:2 [Entrophospora sp. SA101]
MSNNNDNDEFERVFVYDEHKWYNRLKGKTYYRVFGNWECNDCGNLWPSAYTWISFKKFLEGVDANLLVNSKLRMYQRCSGCLSDHSARLLNYYQLGERGSGPRGMRGISGGHRRDLWDPLFEKIILTGIDSPDDNVVAAASTSTEETGTKFNHDKSLKFFKENKDWSLSKYIDHMESQLNDIFDEIYSNYAIALANRPS